MSVLVLFVGAMSGMQVAILLSALFAGAITAAIGALGAFGFEMLVASRGVRRVSLRSEAEAEDQRASRPGRADES